MPIEAATCMPSAVHVVPGPPTAATAARMRSATEAMPVGVAPRQDHDELVAAVPEHGVGVAGRAEDGGRDLPQQPVAGLVAQRVVDVPELVEVDDHEAERLARRHAARRASP